METRHLFNWLSTKAASLNLLAQPATEPTPQE
jgi:hypothetical protein